MTDTIAIAEELREYTALKYAGNCKCGKCQLVPGELVDRVCAALRASTNRAGTAPSEDENASLRDQIGKLHRVCNERDVLRNAMQEACDLLAERKHGSPARSPGHNARLALETALKTPPCSPENQPITNNGAD